MNEKHLEILFQLAHQIQLATQASEAADRCEQALLTAADLARLFKFDHDTVKKHLKTLKDLGLILSVGMNPKRYRFDQYQFKQLLVDAAEDSLAYQLLLRLEAANPLTSSF